MNKLFVYGIFLGEEQRQRFGMRNPRYATVEGYATEGSYIVQAIPFPGLTLTGLLVDINPERWPDIDALERGYDRIEIITTGGIEAYMYVAKEGRIGYEQAE